MEEPTKNSNGLKNACSNGLNSKKLPSSENGSLQSKERKTPGSLELTTAMGSTIEQDLEQTNMGESKESEENLKDTLTNKISELEAKLKQTNEYYEKLTNDVSAAKSMYEKEREECEDVVSVAKRNIESQVDKIIQLQRKKRNLATSIYQEKENLKKEEHKTRIQLKSEEERLTRNIVILQTKLLINEGIKFERDQLLSKIQAVEVDLVEKEDHYRERLREAKDKIQEKYNRLYQIANDHKETIMEQVKNLSLRQQIEALKQAQIQIVRTQSAYKKTSRNLLKKMDQNKMLNQNNHNMEIQVAVQKSLISAASSMVEETKKEEECELVNEQVEESRDIRETTEDLTELKRKIDEFKNQIFRGKDEEDELNEILEDQKGYHSIISEQNKKLHETEQRLLPLSDLAEYISKTGKAELKEDYQDPVFRYEFYQKLSAILTESEKLQKYWPTEQSNIQESEQEDISTPSPFDEPLKIKGKTSEMSMKYSPFTRRLDKVEKKILSDLKLLGKYGTKQKKYAGYRQFHTDGRISVKLVHECWYPQWECLPYFWKYFL